MYHTPPAMCHAYGRADYTGGGSTFETSGSKSYFSGNIVVRTGFFLLAFYYYFFSLLFSSPKDTLHFSQPYQGLIYFLVTVCLRVSSFPTLHRTSPVLSGSLNLLCGVGAGLGAVCAAPAFPSPLIHTGRRILVKKKRSNISFLHPLECRPGWSFSELRWSRCWWSLDLSSSETRMAFRRSTLTKYNQ